MSKKTHAEEERTLSAKSEKFIQFLMNSGYLADPKIEDPKIRSKKQEMTKKSYHNTKLLLKNYRDIIWAMECVPSELKTQLDLPLDELDALISRLDIEMSMENKKIEGRLQTILKSRILINRINEAISFLKSKPKEGQLLYDVIYHTYIGEEKDSIFEVMEELGLSKEKYYKLRKRAISMISIKLWSATDSSIELWMELLSLFDD